MLSAQALRRRIRVLKLEIRELEAENEVLARTLDSVTDQVVAYTAEQPIRQGETVQVRVPRRFVNTTLDAMIATTILKA